MTTTETERRSRALSHMREISLQMERRFARFRVVGLLIGCGIGIPLATAGLLPLRMSLPAFVAASAATVLYSVLYQVLRPFERSGLRRWARVSTLIDSFVVLLFMVNSGGVLSPTWLAVPLLLLTYTLRFGYTRWELTIAMALVGGMFGACVAVVATPLGTSMLALATILVVSFLTVALAVQLVLRERQAYGRAIEAESRAMSIMVQTLQHEVNNPLAILSGNLELLESQTLLPQDTPYLRRIRTAMNRISLALDRLEHLKDDPALRTKQDIWAYIADRRTEEHPDEAGPPEFS